MSEVSDLTSEEMSQELGSGNKELELKLEMLAIKFHSFLGMLD